MTPLRPTGTCTSASHLATGSPPTHLGVLVARASRTRLALNPPVFGRSIYKSCTAEWIDRMRSPSSLPRASPNHREHRVVVRYLRSGLLIQPIRRVEAVPVRARDLAD